MKVKIRVLLEDVSKDVLPKIEKELKNYCIVLHAKYGIRCEIKIGPFYNTAEEVEA